MKLRIILLDDEKLALTRLKRVVSSVLPEAEICSFDKTSEMIEELKHKARVDILFTDIEMPGITGVELARQVREQSPETHIIFVTGYSEYAVDAFGLQASGYLLKPITEEDVLKAIHAICHPIPPISNPEVRVQCFGNFEVLVNGKPLMMKRSKSKELLAYLIDRRGAGATGGELCSILWENRETTESLASQLRHVYSDLNSALKKANADDILIKSRNQYSVATDKVDCDLYRLLQGDEAAANEFRGEYMSQYSWAEFSLPELIEKTKKTKKTNDVD